MSVSTELQRIQQAKADIITSLVNKGATVPQDALIDDLPDIIDDLPSGGGGNELLKSIDVEDFTGTTFSNVRTYITDVTFPNGVTSIGNNACEYCPGLTSVTIPSGVTSIGSTAFQYCTGLTSVTFPNSVTSIGTFAFYQCSRLTSVTIPNNVTSIGDGTFSGCRGLTSVTIPSGVTSIGNGAFQSCSGLTDITIPNAVTSIGYNAFQNCSSLTSVTIGSGVTSIGYSAFQASRNLASVTILATTPPTLENANTFANNASGRKIYVPAESVEAYQTASVWSTYAADIEAIPSAEPEPSPEPEPEDNSVFSHVYYSTRDDAALAAGFTDEQEAQENDWFIVASEHDEGDPDKCYKCVPLSYHFDSEDVTAYYDQDTAAQAAGYQDSIDAYDNYNVDPWENSGAYVIAAIEDEDNLMYVNYIYYEPISEEEEE